MSMQINRYTDQSLLIIEPVGDMGLYNLGELRALLQKLRETQSLKVVIDMGKVPGIDSITIGFLLQETTLFTEAGGALKLAKISPSVRKSLTITETLSQMSVYEDLQSAKNSF
jgi:anti-anti-sigma factor